MAMHAGPGMAEVFLLSAAAFGSARYSPWYLTEIGFNMILCQHPVNESTLPSSRFEQWPCKVLISLGSNSHACRDRHGNGLCSFSGSVCVCALQAIDGVHHGPLPSICARAACAEAQPEPSTNLLVPGKHGFVIFADWAAFWAARDNGEGGEGSC
jgi:hypothetical protein